MKMMLSDCAEAVQGKLIGEDVAITSVSIDTRAIKPGNFILQLKGTTLMVMSLLIKLKRQEQLLLSCIKVLNQPYRILLLMIRG